MLKQSSLLLFAAASVGSAGRELASKPPMGYSTWNALECKPSEKKVHQIADKLKKSGFLSLGYQFFIIDDCWMSGTRTQSQRLAADAERFPAGMAAMAKYLRFLGFKFGIYTNRGPTTCAGLPASMDHEAADADTFASWGADLVKNDGCWDPDCGSHQAQFPDSGICGAEGRQKAAAKYQTMRELLDAAGSGILHMVVGGQPWYAPVGRRLGNVWRVAAEVESWEGVYENVRVMEQLTAFHGPGGWNDPGTLLGSSQGGKFQLRPLQARAQFSLWVVMAAPLVLGVNVLHMSGWDVETFSNKDAIRINQDALGKAGKVVLSTCPPYPNFSLSADPSTFAVPQAALYDTDVLCGSHRAKTCAECPRGHGEGWCHSDCRWVEVTETCVREEKAVNTPRVPRHDKPEPWTIPAFRDLEKRQCWQVWTKELQGGDIAVAAVNFASDEADITLPLHNLGLQVGQRALVRDLWYQGPLLNHRVISGALLIKLKADGGHSLLRLQALRNGSLIEAELAGARLLANQSEGKLSTPEEAWVDNDYELSPPEDRLRRIAERHKRRRRPGGDIQDIFYPLNELFHRSPLHEPGLPSAFWLMALGVGLAMAGLIATLLGRLGLFRSHATKSRGPGARSRGSESPAGR